mmetsp:Transcript_28832/g.85112  ORF Transcript_28832/g.85112 Transcript_28832/m.85112 type:complete len:219 (+) Transcript_28832:855-1511(+)
MAPKSTRGEERTSNGWVEPSDTIRGACAPIPARSVTAGPKSRAGRGGCWPCGSTCGVPWSTIVSCARRPISGGWGADWRIRSGTMWVDRRCARPTRARRNAGTRRNGGTCTASPRGGDTGEVPRRSTPMAREPRSSTTSSPSSPPKMLTWDSVSSVSINPARPTPPATSPTPCGSIRSTYARGRAGDSRRSNSDGTTRPRTPSSSRPDWGRTMARRTL